MDILKIIKARASTRAFLEKAVDAKTIESILEAARWAPSWVNIQPWRVVVVTGDTKDKIGEAYYRARLSGARPRPDFPFRPEQWGEPYKSRRRACRAALFTALGIRLKDREGRLRACMGGYRFFGAPAGLMLFMDRGFGASSLLDIGMFAQNIALAAQGYGLGACAIAAVAEYPGIARSILKIPESEGLALGMALGYADTGAPINAVRPGRADVASFTTWYD
ncbi:MAG: nitroreductase [Candidatus Nitrospinota bacterium M3_3B_026]